MVCALFFALGTQWKYSATGELIGLDHLAVESTMSLKNIVRRKRSKLFEQIKLMESIVLEFIHNKH